MNLEDLFSEDRTLLSVERTLLAYVRTSATVFLAGLGVAKLFENDYIQYIGIVLCISSVILLFFGIYHSHATSSQVRELFKKKLKKSM